MRLNSISILNYKNISQADLNFPAKINCFVGNNGMGKTNLLDAIYYLSFCKSHSNSIDSQIIKHDTDFLMIQGKYELRGNEEDIYCGIKRRQKKNFKRNKKEYQRLSDHIGLIPLVLISPYDDGLIAEGSDERRKFMDGVISQYNNQYLSALIQYNNALKQRNALLKDETMTDTALFEIWEEQMATHGDYIYGERKKFVERFIPLFKENYSFISDDKEKVDLVYKSQLHDADLAEKLSKNRERDRIIGFSMNGIHKDDLEMSLAGYPMKRVGSQGQNKSFLISLKLAQFSFLKETQGINPILLLDDIFDKLDEERVTKIIELVAGNDFGQIFISDTNSSHWEEILPKIKQSSAIFKVVDGEIKLI
ncbi:MAG: DNA replication/repair protein RecF [Porphyromonadaceae bacterium]|jgi:DNA replication and repair protein RecF|nr:DNA replication/repair protein RecF [Porphyromonadaceae bacterium]